jgi:hypothetical protein
MSNLFVTTRPHSVRVVPQFCEQLRGYIEHYIRCCQSKIEEYQTELSKQRADGLRPIAEGHTVVIEARREIKQAQVIGEAMNELKKTCTSHRPVTHTRWVVKTRK